MNFKLATVVTALGIFMNCAAHAQDKTQGLTRAEVTAELVDLELVGYHPSTKNNYPDNIEAAEKRLAAKRLDASAPQTTSVNK